MSEQGLHLRQGLQQTIGPQMQQSLNILQVPSIELRQLVRAEMEQNPTLEDVTEEVSLEEISTGEEGFEEPEVDIITTDWSDFLDNQAPSPGINRADEDARRQFMLDSLVSHPTLQEYLRGQIELIGLPRSVANAVEILLGDMDDSGFLETGIEDLCLSLALPMADLLAAKKVLNGLDPPGVGAADLRDSLLIQLERLKQTGTLAYRVVERHVAALARKRFEEIARDLGSTPDQVIAAQDKISSLDPYPARNFSSQPTIYIRPDVIVTRAADGDYVVRLTGEAVPDLRVSGDYLEMLAESGGNRDARKYIRGKIRDSKFLIRSIQQRQETIQKIAAQIVARQRDFLRDGTDRLHPMNMAEIANSIDVHETTVSRAVSGKYILTPQGLFELRFFFSSGYQTDSGDAMSNVGVKNAISSLVDDEDSSHPLSDQKIVELLEDKGIRIARRTVAKYRDALKILPSHLRRGA